MATLISRALKFASFGGVRIFLALLGIISIGWGTIFVSIDADHAAIDRAAKRIMRGEAFKPAVLLDFERLAEAVERESSCWPRSIRSAAVIRVQLAEIANSIADPISIDRSMMTLRATIQRSLSCSPDDPFLWFVLYWVEVSQGGFRPELIEYLRKSYELGPYEGWIGLRRSRFALAVYQQLPEDVAKKVVSEFAVLLNSGFVAEMVANLSGPGWPVRDVLISNLYWVKQIEREAFANELSRNGFEVSVPGIELKELRPWNR
jgi:hypothetical protein